MPLNQPPKKTVAPECSSNMRFVKPSRCDLLVQRISRNTLILAQWSIKEMLTSGCIRESMPCSALQHSGDISLKSHVLFSHCSLNSTIKKVVDPTPVVC